jgi:RNA polymerase sigma-70 factor (ECF subfamily)
MTGNDHDALDATQDALIALTRGIGRYDGRAAFTTWAYRVTTNACLDELRRRKRRPVPASTDHAERGQPEDVAEVRGGAPNLDQTVADRTAIDQALQSLPADFRAPVVLRDVLGLDYAEIADVLDLPPGTVRSRIARGRRALADHLGHPRGGNQTGAGHVERNAP